MRDELQTARRNFPRAEYELVRDSFPETLHHLSPARLNSRIARCERLIESYQVRLHDKESLEHTWRGPDRLGSARLIRYRMNHLNICLKKFRTELRKSAKSKKASVSRKITLKASPKTKSVKAKRSPSVSMKTKSPTAKRKSAGTSKLIGGVAKRARSADGSRRKAVTRKVSSESLGSIGSPDKRRSQSRGGVASDREENQRNLTLQPKMHLSRQNFKRGSEGVRDKQRSDKLAGHNINPTRRR